MSQSRFSIVLVGVSALLRRPLVSRLRPADGERSPWVVFAARGCRFDSGFRSAGWPSGFCFRFSACTASELPSAGWPSGSPLPLFGTHRFGNCRWAGWPSGSLLLLFGTHRFGVAARWVDLRAHGFRFSGCAVSEIAAWRVGLRAHRFRFSACTASGLPCRRREGRRSTPTRHLFHFKTLIPTC